MIDTESNWISSAEDAPECLVEIADYLNKVGIKVSESKDGRVGSIKDEDIIIDCLKKSDDFIVIDETDDDGSYGDKVTCVVPKSRQWYDLIVVDGLKRYYVNIKSSMCSGYDNSSSVSFLMYGLFGKIPNEAGKANQYAELFNEFNKYDKIGFDTIKNIDYYFIVLNKSAINNVFVTSLNHITKDSIKPNGSNPPFQCNWSKNSPRIEMSKEDVCKIVMEIVYWSLAKPLDFFRKMPVKQYMERTGKRLDVPYAEETLW